MLQTCFSSIDLSASKASDRTTRAEFSPMKRAIDVVGAGLGLLLLLPVMAVIAVLIRLGSRGPILFRQERLGWGGRTFSCLKFRTMIPDAEAKLRELEALNEVAGGVLFKIKDDPRVTRLGRILRPKEAERPACFYSLITRDTREMDFAHHRQLFLTEQGYSYEILDEAELSAQILQESKATG